MEEILDLLNIEPTGEIKDNTYTEDITNYNEFTDYYNTFDNSLDVSRESNDSYMNEDDIYILFEGNNFHIEMTGSLTDDTYKLKITKEM